MPTSKPRSRRSSPKRLTAIEHRLDDIERRQLGLIERQRGVAQPVSAGLILQLLALRRTRISALKRLTRDELERLLTDALDPTMSWQDAVNQFEHRVGKGVMARSAFYRLFAEVRAVILEDLRGREAAPAGPQPARSTA